MSETARREGKAEGLVFRALEGHKIVAGGNAPGKREVGSSDPEGVELPWASGCKTGVAPAGFDPVRVGPCGGRASGGVAPGYSNDPLWGSRIDSAEDAPGALEADC
jgi:hypothetical protein